MTQLDCFGIFWIHTDIPWPPKYFLLITYIKFHSLCYKVMSFDKCTVLCSHHYSINIEYGHCSKKSLCALSSLIPPNFWSPLIFLLCLQFPFFRMSYNWDQTICSILKDWLLSVSNMHLCIYWLDSLFFILKKISNIFMYQNLFIIYL